MRQRTSGPTATALFVSAFGALHAGVKYSPYARTNTEIVRAVTTLLVIPKSRDIASAAGAIIDDDTGLMNVKDETTIVAAHFFLYDQLGGIGEHVIIKPYLIKTHFLGFSGSSAPSQSTIRTPDSPSSLPLLRFSAIGFSLPLLIVKDVRRESSRGSENAEPLVVGRVSVIK